MLATLASSSTHAQQSEHTFAAVVRHDGSMIPIAAFDGKQWWDRWPLPWQRPDDLPALPSTAIPPDWTPPGMQLPVDWRLYLETGREVPIKALGPIATFMLDPERVIGLRTNYSGKDIHETGGALAVSGTADVGRFVKASQHESDAIAKQLDERLAAIEAIELARWTKEMERPADAARKLQRVFRDADRTDPPAFSVRRSERPFNGRTYYHVSGEKLYAGAVSTDDSYKINLSFDGVAATDEKGRVVFENVSAFAWAEYCGDPADRYEPIATLRVRDQLVWVGIAHLEDGFSYVLTDPHTNTLTLRRHPFVRVPLEFHDDGCTVPDLCRTLDVLRAAAASRRYLKVASHLSSRAKEQLGSYRNLAAELKDPASAAWPALARVLTVGGRLQQGGTRFCAPGIHAAWAGDERQAFRDGVEVDTIWAVVRPAANVYEWPDETSKVIAVAGRELVAVTTTVEWHSSDADDAWVTVRWDRAVGYMRRRDVLGPDDPGLCLDRENGSWRIFYFRVR